MSVKTITGWKGIQQEFSRQGVRVSLRTIQYWHQRIPLPLYQVGRKGVVWTTDQGIRRYIRERKKSS